MADGSSQGEGEGEAVDEAVDDAQLEAYFKACDEDGDGRITFEDLKRVFGHDDNDWADDVLMAVMNKVDTLGKGWITSREFKRAAKVIMEQAPSGGSPAGGADGGARRRDRLRRVQSALNMIKTPSPSPPSSASPEGGDSSGGALGDAYLPPRRLRASTGAPRVSPRPSYEGVASDGVAAAAPAGRPAVRRAWRRPWARCPPRA